MLEVFGCGAFVLLFLGDCNDWKWADPRLRVCFPLGLGSLGLITAVQSFWAPARLHGALYTAVLALAALFLWLLVYTLFFALSVKEAYGEPGQARTVRTGGVYALCRHPGVLWFAGLYACLYLATGLSLRAALLYNGLNLLLVLFEDVCVFPAHLQGYDGYRRTTPFLLPSPASVRACLRTEKQSADEGKKKCGLRRN